MTPQELELIIDRTDPRGPPDAPPWRVVREDDFRAMTDALARLIAERQDVMDALGNGADEHTWPPGLTVPQAVARLRAEAARLAASLRQGDLARAEEAGFVTVPLDVLDKLHDHYCGPERSDPVADPLWAELGRYVRSSLLGKGRKA